MIDSFKRHFSYFYPASVVVTLVIVLINMHWDHALFFRAWVFPSIIWFIGFLREVRTIIDVGPEKVKDSILDILWNTIAIILGYLTIYIYFAVL